MGGSRLRIVRGRIDGVGYGRWAVFLIGTRVRPTGWRFLADFASWEEAISYADGFRNGFRQGVRSVPALA